MVETDRRAHERMNLARPCKLFDPRSRKYVPGTIWNLSDGGALIEVNRPICPDLGELLYLGIALKRRQGILLRDEMCPARVVRLKRTVDGRSTLGIQFTDRLTEASPVQINQAA